jgi:hypothetical protein
VIFDHGEAKAAQMFGVFAHNLPSGATFRVTRGTTSGGTDVYDSTAMPAWPFTPLNGVYDGSVFGVFHRSSAESSARYTEFIFSTAAANLTFGRAFIGPLFAPDIGASELVDSWLPPFGSLVRAESGADWIVDRPSLRSAKVLYKFLHKAQASKLHEIHRVHGVTGEVVFYPYIAGTDAAQQFGFLGTLAQMPEVGTSMTMVRDMYVLMHERGGAP